MNPNLVPDLAQHTLSRIAKVMEQSMALLDDEGDEVALMIMVVGSMLSSFANTMAHKHPAWAALDEEARTLAAISVVAGAAKLGTPEHETLYAISRAVHAIRIHRV